MLARLEPKSRHREVWTDSGAVCARVEDEMVALRRADGTLIATFDAASGELTLSAPRRLRLAAEQVAIEAGSLEVTSRTADWSVGQWQLHAERVIERARDVFRTAEGIVETRARRARTIVERTLEMVAGRTTIRSEEDTRVDGKRVLLG